MHDTNISSSQIKGKFTISDHAKEGIDFIVLPDSIAYLLYNNYGVDIILKSRKKHVFDLCTDEENCPFCIDNWNNKEKYSLITLFTEFKDSTILCDEDQKRHSHPNSSLLESFIWGLSQELSQAVINKKRGCLSFLQC